MTDKHSPLPWSYDGHYHYDDCGARFREILDAENQPVIGEFGCISHGDCKMIVSATRAYSSHAVALREIAHRTEDFSHGDNLLQAFVRGINKLAVDALASTHDRP